MCEITFPVHEAVDVVALVVEPFVAIAECSRVSDVVGATHMMADENGASLNSDLIVLASPRRHDCCRRALLIVITGEASGCWLAYNTTFTMLSNDANCASEMPGRIVRSSSRDDGSPYPRRVEVHDASTLASRHASPIAAFVDTQLNR